MCFTCGTNPPETGTLTSSKAFVGLSTCWLRPPHPYTSSGTATCTLEHVRCERAQNRYRPVGGASGEELLFCFLF